jgi:hypothetical protein
MRTWSLNVLFPEQTQTRPLERESCTKSRRQGFPHPTSGHWPRDIEGQRSRIRSHVTTDGQSVSQYVKVSSPLWDLWPDITFCPKVVFWKLLSFSVGRPLWREVGCHLSFLVCSNLPTASSSGLYIPCEWDLGTHWTGEEVYTMMMMI